MATETRTQHTPGPWHQTLRQADGTVAVTNTMAYVVCLLQDPQQDLANAQLIAAAPELLEALKLLYRDAMAWRRRTGVPTLDKRLAYAREAIKKAEPDA